MKRRLFAFVLAAGFALFVPSIVSADTLTLVTIDCGDGSPLQVTADTAMLTELQASIQAMIDNPSGLTCTLSTSPLLTSPLAVGTAGFAADDPPFVVGGGRYPLVLSSTETCELNFGTSAPQTNPTTHAARGTETVTIANPSTCPSLGKGHLKATVDCLMAATTTQQGVNLGELSGTITGEATGFFSNFTGDAWISDVTDNGHGSADQITQSAAAGGYDCVAPLPGQITLDNGNLTVKGAS